MFHLLCLEAYIQVIDSAAYVTVKLAIRLTEGISTVLAV
jgi:hypothetical protein